MATNVDQNEDFSASDATDGSESSAGPFLATVIGHQDPNYMGTLEVELLRPSGNNKSSGQLHQVKYMSPFYGVTSVSHVSDSSDDFGNTQKSYGMWMIPPDPGTTVVVFFIDGDPKRGYWMGCVADENMNFMMPGLAATESTTDADGIRKPTGEYNKRVNAQAQDPEQFKKPVHPLAQALETQGLLKDDIRGITTSSARRETPSMVFGISTPGPIDKQPGAKTGNIGKLESEIPNAFVSRLGGTTFVMNDGDEHFIRKTPAGGTKGGPMEYVAVEQGEDGGDPTIPHNELFRIRTRTGHQILFHNSEDLIYIGNARGTTWIEMTSNGKIDIYAKDSISVHTENDLNFTADRDINMTAKGNINLNSTGLTNLSSTGNFNINSAGTANVTSTNATNISSGAGVLVTGTRIDLNGPAAAKAVKAPKAVRIPQVEPWAFHENLDPALFTPAKTKAVVPAVGANPVTPTIPTPAAFGKYSITTDTFKKILPPEPTENDQGNI